MKPEEKVPSLELCKKLWDLGITKDIETEKIWHIPYRCHKWRIGNYKSIYGNTTDQKKDNYVDRSYVSYIKEIGRLITAPDLSELGELLAEAMFSDGTKRDNYWLEIIQEPANNEPNAKAIMLIQLKTDK